MIPTARTYGLLSLGLILGFGLALAGDLGWSSLGLLVWDLSVLSLVIWDHRRGQPRRVQVNRSALHRLSIGRDNPVELTLQTQTYPAQIQIRDDFPAEFQASTLILKANLGKHQSELLRYTVIPPRRGQFEWGKIQVRQLSPWGLVWQDWTIPQQQTVDVYPDLIGLREISIQLTLKSAGAMRQLRRLGMGTEFAELRDYVPGDDPRLLDWKATARRQHPLVRVLEPEREQTLIILLDRGRLMTAQVHGLKRFDWALNAGLALALAGLHRGDRVGVGVFDRQIHTWIPPQRGQAYLSQLIERLTPIQPDWLEPDYFNVATTVVQQQSRRALVVMLTDLVDATASAELLSALTRLAPRYLPFCVALRDPLVDQQAQTSSVILEQAYARAVALDLIAQRQAAFEILKHKGVLVLDGPANQISQALVDRYLHLKQRNQI